MTDTGFTSTRRALLGAAAAIPALAALSVPALATVATDRGAWERALEKFRRADAAMNAYDRDHLTPASRVYQAVRDKWPKLYDFASDPEAQAELDRASEVYDPVDGRFDHLVTEQFDACLALMLTPSPDSAALVAKVEILIKHEVYEWTDRAEAMAALQQDVRRLLSEGRA